MSGDEAFLRRWSRRKRAAAAEARSPEPTPVPDDAQPAAVAEPETPALADLPPLDAIGPASDITPFLAPGVPLEVTRAALRRAWGADPEIRGFIGLSENAWDFNAPDGMPGFGSLNADQVRRLVDTVIGRSEAAAEPTNVPVALERPPIAPQKTAAERVAADPDRARSSIAAPQRGSQEAKSSESRPPHRHGGALPQ